MSLFERIKNKRASLQEQTTGEQERTKGGADYSNQSDEIAKKKKTKYQQLRDQRIKYNVLKNKKGVIALGGGAFITRAIKNEVLENHLSFWLDWNIDTLVNRIKNSKKRPLAVNSSKNELKEIIKNFDKLKKF